MPREGPAPRRWGRLAFQLAGVLYRREAARSASDCEGVRSNVIFKAQQAHHVQSSRLASLFAATLGRAQLAIFSKQRDEYECASSFRGRRPRPRRECSESHFVSLRLKKNKKFSCLAKTRPASGSHLGSLQAATWLPTNAIGDTRDVLTLLQRKA